MNAIKPPVHRYFQADHEQLWSIRDDDNVRIGRDLTEAQAKAITIALNLHDELLDELKCLRPGLGRPDSQIVDDLISRSTL